MYPIIGIRQALVCIYRFGLIFYCILGVGCDSGPSSDNRKKTPQPDQQTLLDPQALDDAEPPIKKMKRVAKVPEDKQVIALLHGLHRLSWDFKKMKEVLQEKFPHATIFALTCVDKDPNKKGSFSPSPTLKFSIKEQARLAYEEIKKTLTRDSRVILVGNSQGGLRGFTLAKKYGLRLKREYVITIDGLITIGTPWNGAPVMEHIKEVKKFQQRFKEIEATLNAIEKNYDKAVIKYFFRFNPGFAKAWPSLYEIAVPYFMKKNCPGAADLEPKSKFISEYVASNLKEVDVPITAIAGVLTDFSKLFDPFPSSISKQALDKLNATYAELIGGDPNCKHDMLLPVATQHAEGLVTKNFKRITVDGACHGNKVGITVKRGLSELNNQAVIQEVVKAIEETFYEQQEEEVVDKKAEIASAA